MSPEMFFVVAVALNVVLGPINYAKIANCIIARSNVIKIFGCQPKIGVAHCRKY